MHKVKILHVHTLPAVTGSGIRTLIVMKGLDKVGYEVEFACAPGGSLINEIEIEGIKFRPIKHFVQKISPYNDLMALWELVRLIKREKYDIIHTHNSKAGFIGRLAGKISGIPIIIHTVHGFAFHAFEKSWCRKLFIYLERFAARFADRLIVVSEPLEEWGLELNIGKRSQYITIYDGIEIEKFTLDFDIAKKKQELGIKVDDLVVGVVAKLWEGKGHECILYAAKEIMKRTPNVKFMFVGEGYLRDRLEERVKDLGLGDYIIFTGFRADIAEINAIFDIAVLASFFEGLGRVLLEAMVLAKPVVATRVGGIVDVVDDGENGFLVEPNDSDALAEAIIKLLSDEELRFKMGEAAKNKIDRRFSAETMVSKIKELYGALIDKKLSLSKGSK